MDVRELAAEIAKLIGAHPSAGNCAPDCLCWTLVELFPEIRTAWEQQSGHKWTGEMPEEE